MLRQVAVALLLLISVDVEASVFGVKTYPLSQVTNELSDLDPGGVLEQVRLPYTGKPTYDSFFFEVAMVHATLLLADTLTSQLGQALAGAGVIEDPNSDPSEWKTAKAAAENVDLELVSQRSNRLHMLLGPLERLSERVPSLAAQVPGLMDSAPKEFKGWNVRKLPGVMDALRQSATQLRDAGSNTVQTVESVRRIVTLVQP